MNKKHRIFAIAASAMLAFGSVAPAVMPVFAENETGKITIVKNPQNGNVSYTAYQIFSARVDDETTGTTTGKIASDVSWANNLSTNISELINEQSNKDTSKDYTNAQVAAEYIKDNIQNSSASTYDTSKNKWESNGKRVNSSDFAYKLAKKVKKSNITGTTLDRSHNYTTENLPAGYYLIVTNTSTADWSSNTNANASTATSPIFAMVGGSEVKVNEKTSVPYVEKTVTDDATNAEPSNHADAEVGQDLNYTLTGHVADNIASYENYYYKFTDTLHNLDLSGTSANNYDVSIKIDTTAVDLSKNTENINVTKSDGTTSNSDSELTVTFKNLKDVKDSNNQTINVTGSSVVTVTYQAKLTTSARVGKDNSSKSPNYNTVNLTYSNDPHNSGNGTPGEPNVPSTGTTTDKKTYTYTYKLNLTKQDQAGNIINNSDQSKNAKFTIKATGADETDKTKYVQSDGTLGADAYTFTTENGNFHVSGLDAGTYTVTETQAPTGYKTVDSFTFEIKPHYGDDGSLTSLNNANEPIVPSNKSRYVSGEVDSNTNNDGGTINITVKDPKKIALPLTGQQGITFGIVVGGIVVAVSVVAVVRNRKKAEEE